MFQSFDIGLINFRFPVSSRVFDYLFIYLGFEVFTEVNIKITFFWNVTQCSPVDSHQRLGVTCCLHLQARTRGFTASPRMEATSFLRNICRTIYQNSWCHIEIGHELINYLFTHLLLKLFVYLFMAYLTTVSLAQIVWVFSHKISEYSTRKEVGRKRSCLIPTFDLRHWG